MHRWQRRRGGVPWEVVETFDWNLDAPAVDARENGRPPFCRSCKLHSRTRLGEELRVEWYMWLEANEHVYPSVEPSPCPLLPLLPPRVLKKHS